jgi:hypothetical protein
MGRLCCRAVSWVVEEQGNLMLCMKAAQLGDAAATLVEVTPIFHARSALRSECYCQIGSARLHMMVAWSLLL